MIKKILGIVFAATAVAVILAAVMHRGKYTSAVFDEPEAEAVFDATSEDGAAAGAGPLRVPDTNASDRPARAMPEDAPDSLRPADSLHGDAAAE